MNNNQYSDKNYCWFTNYDDKQFRNKHYGREALPTTSTILY